MNKYFEWKEEYSTGDSTVDEQHQYLFNLANRIIVAKPSQCKSIILELFQYTKVHFKAEEKIMAEFNFPELDNHRELHNNLITNLNKLYEKFDESIEYRNNLIEFFGNWIVNHILNEDLRFANFVADTGSVS